MVSTFKFLEIVEIFKHWFYFVRSLIPPTRKNISSEGL